MMMSQVSLRVQSAEIFCQYLVLCPIYPRYFEILIITYSSSYVLRSLMAYRNGNVKKRTKNSPLVSRLLSCPFVDVSSTSSYFGICKIISIDRK